MNYIFYIVHLNWPGHKACAFALHELTCQ